MAAASSRLTVMADLEEVRPQVRGIDAAVLLPVGVAWQEDAGASVVQEQYETEVVHPGVQGGELFSEYLRLHGRVKRPYQCCQLPFPLRRRCQNTKAKPLAQLALGSGGQRADGGAAGLQPAAESSVVVQPRRNLRWKSVSANVSSSGVIQWKTSGGRVYRNAAGGRACATGRDAQRCFSWMWVETSRSRWFSRREARKGTRPKERSVYSVPSVLPPCTKMF